MQKAPENNKSSFLLIARVSVFIGFTVCIAVLNYCSGVFQNELQISQSIIPADGFSQGRVTLVKHFLGPEEDFLPLKKEENQLIEILGRDESSSRNILIFRSTLNPGRVTIRTDKNQSVVIQFFLPGITDADEDHFPDTAELNAESDRNAFLDWFVRIAESQFKKKNYGWNPDEQDCSGLIRYSYREALKKHNTEWYRKNGIVMDKNLPDVDRFNYPDVPLIGKKIFKIKKGPASDPESFGVYADAKTLMSFNLDFISRDINEANQGDILFFHDPDNFNSPYHSMIVVKNDLQDIILLYHTGTEQGIKRIPLSYLENSERFYPGVWNRYFMGIFRFHIIR